MERLKRINKDSTEESIAADSRKLTNLYTQMRNIPIRKRFWGDETRVHSYGELQEPVMDDFNKEISGYDDKSLESMLLSLNKLTELIQRETGKRKHAQKANEGKEM